MQIHIHSKRKLVKDLVGGRLKMKFKKWVEILLQFEQYIYLQYYSPKVRSNHTSYSQSFCFVVSDALYSQ